MCLDRELNVYEELAGLDLVRASVQVLFPGDIALVSSFGIESAILLDMVAKVDPAVPVIFLSTGRLFRETLAYRRVLEERLGLENIMQIEADPEDIARDDPRGDLWRYDPDRCCEIRKVRPLERVLERYGAWMTGRKRYHGGARAALQKIERVDGKVKINPLVDWSRADVASWARAHDLPRHPLAARGFTSVGCVPCTRRTQAWEGVRDGRWAGREKTECGIHRPSGR